MLRRHIARLSSQRLYADQHAYQKTLILPKTKFPQRSNLQKTFDQLIPQSSQDIYCAQLNQFLEEFSKLENDELKSKFIEEKLFLLHDGPPYANGDLHLGHALNKIIKDIINRYQLSQGKFVHYKPGWDCHGLPIEMKALKDISSEGVEAISATKIRSIAANHANKAIKAQMKQFQQFAIMTNWKDYYNTMSPEYEIDQLKVFLKMVRQGLIKRQNKPVFWGTETRTALAEGELEYNEAHKSTAAYVKFPLTSESNLHLLERLPTSVMVEYLVDKARNDTINCLIWTSTPWTLLSNKAICFNEKFSYSLVMLKDSSFIVEENLLRKLDLPEPYEVMATFPGSTLAGLYYTQPLLRDGKQRPLLNGEHVTNTTGTGLVHTAPGHGSDDYTIGLQNKLEIFSPVDHTGRYNLKELPHHLHDLLTEPDSGLPMKVLDSATTSAILKEAERYNMLYSSHEYTHSYPYDWRSKKPVIIRATPQWFADLHDVKKFALDSLKSVKFHPERGHARLSSFIKSRNEWCISRQRSWGVPIPALHRKDDPDSALMTEETVGHIIDVIKRKGTNAWFSQDESDMEEWLPPSLKSEAMKYSRGRDTMDVWFDSGTSWGVIERFYADVLKVKDLPKQLADVYLEGSDQHRGWFQSSLLTKVARSGSPVAPYKTLITHGFTLDENGVKMSKSIGNTISPNAVIEGDQKTGLPSLGVDGLRYLVAQSDYTTDIVAGPTIVNHVADALKKLRLSFRFLLGNLQVSNQSLLPYEQLRPVDKYTIYKLQELLTMAKQDYEDYNFSKVLTAIQHHTANQLSAFYFDVSKDCLYSDAKESLKRQQVQTTLFHILDTYRAILMPILPVLIQEVWNYVPQHLKVKGDVPESPFMRPWPCFQASEYLARCFENNELALLNEFRSKFNKLGGITKSTQAAVTIYTDAESLPCSVEEINDIIQAAQTTIVSSSFDKSSTEHTLVLGDNTKVRLVVNPSELSKCPRCWKHSAQSEGALCRRCDDVVAHAK